MTHHPKRDCGERFEIAVGFPEGTPDNIVGYENTHIDAYDSAKGVALRQDACRGIVTDRQGDDHASLIRDEEGCLTANDGGPCKKCAGVSFWHNEFTKRPLGEPT